VLEISMRALPFAYRDIGATPGAAVVVIVEGESGGAWSLVRRATGWDLFVGDAGAALARIRMSEDTAWRLFFRVLPGEEARRRMRIEGDQELGAVALDVAALMV
jgi:hypothetical protein